MSTNEIISQIQSLPFSEQLTVIEETLKTIRAEMKSSKSANKKDDKHGHDLRRRRKSFKIEAFDLGKDVVIDRDEIYSDRGT